MDSKKILAMLLILSVAGLAGCININTSRNGNGDREHTVTAVGNSELRFDPDQAEVYLGFSIVKDSAEEAQNEANRVTNAIIDGLRYKGISENDIQTERLSLHEEHRWEDGTSRIVGWRATQNLKITTEDLNKVGTIIDVAVENGANRINNINFGLSKEKEQEYKNQALELAVKNAREKAEILAVGSGHELGMVKQISEADFYYMPFRYAMESVEVEDAARSAATVIPSDVVITARVNAVYYVR